MNLRLAAKSPYSYSSTRILAPVSSSLDERLNDMIAEHGKSLCGAARECVVEPN